LGGEFAEVDEGAALAVVAVMGEGSAVEANAEGSGLDAAVVGGGVDVDEDGRAHVYMMPAVKRPAPGRCSGGGAGPEERQQLG